MANTMMYMAPSVIDTRPCAECGASFEVDSRHPEQQYCSRSCGMKAAWANGNKTYSPPKEQTTLECEWCGEEYERGGQASRSKYCSQSCNSAHYRESHKTEQRECDWCDETFMADPRKNTRFCGRSCAGKHVGDQRGEPPRTVECQECGDEFKLSDNSQDQKFCSRRCYGLSRRVERVEQECEWCGDPYTVKESRAEESRYCSNPCRLKGTFHGLGERRKANCGHLVRSEGERTICNWLDAQEIYHRYEPETPAGLADWQVGNTYIEYWGGSGLDNYAENRARKEAAYNDHECDFIGLEEDDLNRLDERLGELL